MLTPEFLAASMIALGIATRGEAVVPPRATGRAPREAAVRSRRGRRLRKRGFPPAAGASA